MKFPRRKKMHSAVEAASLSDILFFLLMFFLMISTMASPNAIKLLLPQSDKTQSASKKAIHLSINEQKEYYIESQRIDPGNLEQELSNRSQASDTQTIILRIEKGNSVQDLVDVYDIIGKLNLHLVLATSKGK